MTEILDRQAHIRKIVATHVNMESLSCLRKNIEFPIEKYMLNQHLRFSCHPDRMIGVLISELMNDLRGNGLVSACPNNGPRCVPFMQSWNSWVKNGCEKGDDPSLRYKLFSTPAFDALNDSLLHHTSLYFLEMKQSGNSFKVIQETDFDNILSNVIDETMAVLTGHSPVRIPVYPHYCRLSGDSVRCSDNPLDPVLSKFDENSGTWEILPIIETIPKPVRHLILDLPSQELLMTKQFVIKGFKEGLDALTGCNFYDISYQNCIDDCVRDCIEKAGLAVIHLYESWPDAYAAGDGIWRMSHIDAAHDVFMSDGKPTDVAPPQPAWSFDMGPSVNHLADPETVIDILMASGIYESRTLAHEALDAGMKEYDIVRIPMPGIEHLHIHAPTGYGVLNKCFEDQFRAEEIEYNDWQQDAYVISARPLTVSPDVLEDDVWRKSQPVMPEANIEQPVP